MARQMKDSGIEWIGEIPATWDISRIKYVADFEPACDTARLNGNSVITYTPMECIKKGWFINNTAPMESVSSSLTPFQNGDIVMAKVTPCFENGNIAIMENLASGYGLGSSELFVFRPVAVDTRYFFYWLQNPLFVQLARSTMTGTGGLKRVSPYFAKNCYIHRPPIAEQRRIVDFLDRKCAEIDAVIERTKATIEEYKKLKQAVITEAVTKGVRGPRPMKDSGIEWIGEIPEAWRLAKMHHVCATITDYVASGSFASLAENVVYLDEPDYAMLVRTMDVSGKGYSGKPVYINQHAYEFLSNSNLFGGEIMLPNIGASVGDVYIVPKLYERMSLAPNSIMLRTNINDKFVYYFFMSNSGRRSVLDIAESTAQPKFNKTDFRQLRMPLPCDEEQDEIVAYLDEKCAALDTLIAKKTALLTELETYKKSLIYEYVTGKKEVL